jgi:hypothetical protein
MARIIYQYQDNSALRDPPEEAPIPQDGDVIERNGQQWLVDGVAVINTHTPSGTAITEYVVNLVSPGQDEMESYEVT